MSEENKDHKFTDAQNQIFAGMFDAIKSERKGVTFQVQAHTIIDMDDANFIKLWTDPNCTLVGTAEEKEIASNRARYLNLI